MQILFAVAPIVNFRGGGGGAEGEEAAAEDVERHYPALTHERADERGDEHAIGARDSTLADELALYIAELVLQVSAGRVVTFHANLFFSLTT